MPYRSNKSIQSLNIDKLIEKNITMLKLVDFVDFLLIFDKIILLFKVVAELSFTQKFLFDSIFKLNKFDKTCFKIN